MNYLLDTNIVLTYIRDTEVSRKIEKRLNLLNGKHNILLSVVSIGELKSIALQNKWGKRKIATLLSFLKKFIIIDINIEEIINRYAEIDAFSQGRLKSKKVSFSARNMGKNDLWIAATASVYNLQFLTTDKDFNHLDKEYISLNLLILEEYL